MKTYICRARLARGPELSYEVEAKNKRDANWHARRAAYADGHRGAIRFRAELKPIPKEEEIRTDR
jgi:hypothetical protein